MILFNNSIFLLIFLFIDLIQMRLTIIYFKFFVLKKVIINNKINNQENPFLDLEKKENLNSFKENNVEKINYYYDKKPKITILIFHFKLILGENDLMINMIKSLLNQTLKEIEIYLIINKIEKFFLNQFSQIYKNLKIINEENDAYKNIIKVILESNANYITILKKYMNIKDKNFFENIYINTFGKINNIYEYKIEKEIIYLIKTKILKNLIDNEIVIDPNHLEEYIKLLPKENINYISIAYTFDNKYTFYSYISMISVLESKNIYTYISFYLVVPKSFSKENRNIIESLYEQYDFLNITFIYMDDRYKKVEPIRYLNQNAYYRLSLGELLPNLNRIIYLDCDLIVYKDLTNLFNLNFNGYLMLSRKTPVKIAKLYQINSGVLLLNLKKMREINLEKSVLNIIYSGFKSIVFDQGLLIKYYLNKIGYLEEKYNVPSVGLKPLINHYLNKSLNNKTEDLLYALRYPTIRHFNGPKKSQYFIDSKDWWYFASKSKYYQLLLNYRNQKIK